jgi:phosphate transport system substrate-binding protein
MPYSWGQIMEIDEEPPDDPYSEIILTRYLGDEAEVVVPAHLNGKAVKALKGGYHSSFFGQGVKKVIISPGISEIGTCTFEDCTGLESVTIPDTVTSIGNYAFAGCTALASVTIPDSVDVIKFSAFEGCTALVSIDIPEGVISIGNYAFKNCTSLVSIKLPGSISWISSVALEGCTALETISIHADVDEKGYDEFYLRGLGDGKTPFLLKYRYSVKAAPADDGQNLIDGTYLSWTGESITFSAENAISPAGFALKNGNGDLDLYGQHGRVKSFRVFADGVETETISIKDSLEFEQYRFSKPVKAQNIRLLVSEIYPGTEQEGACVAEILLLNRIVDESKFHDQVLLWTGKTDIDWDGEIAQQPFVTKYRQKNNLPDLDREGEFKDFSRGVSDELFFVMNYLPFNVSKEDYLIGEINEYNAKRFFDYDENKSRLYKYTTRIANLSGESTLKFQDNFPRLDGATALYPVYSAFVHAVYPAAPVQVFETGNIVYFWRYMPIFINNAVGELHHAYLTDNERYATRGYKGEQIPFEQSLAMCSKTAKAYQRLLAGEADIIFCYSPSAQEEAAAEALGLRYKLTPLGQDAFVFIVNANNPVDGITVEQIRDIYSGKTDNWKDITGRDGTIIAYQRPANSGSQTALESIMGSVPIKKPLRDTEEIRAGMRDLYDSIVSDYYNYRNAIGYSFLFYVKEMTALRELGDGGAKVLAINGVKPDAASIQSGAYPFCRTIYAVTIEGRESENTKRLLDWATGPQGQELVQKTGYIPIH